MPTKSSSNTASNTSNSTTKATRKGNIVATANKTTEFEILDEEPEFRSPPGRAKSALRIAMESLAEGKSLVAATLVDDEAADKNTLAGIRGKAQEIAKANGARYSVRIDVQNRVIVTRRPSGSTDTTTD